MTPGTPPNARRPEGRRTCSAGTQSRGTGSRCAGKLRIVENCTWKKLSEAGNVAMSDVILELLGVLSP